MALSDNEKLDILWKRVNFGKTETDSVGKEGYNETIPSPVPTYSKDVWNESELIPVPPTLGVGLPFVTDYEKYRCTEDFSVPDAKTWLATTFYGDPLSRKGDWIDTTFSPEYQIEIFDGDPDVAGVKLDQAAPGEEWHFDYIAGVLYFPNGLPSGVTEIWLTGYRYIGEKGVGSGAGGGSANWQYINHLDNNHSALDNDGLIVDTSVAQVIVELPASPAPNDTITLVPYGPYYDINSLVITTIDGENIGGDPSDLIIDQRGFAVQLSYVDASVGWGIIPKGDTLLINQIDDSGVGIYFRLTEGEEPGTYDPHVHSVAITNAQMLDLIQGNYPAGLPIESNFILTHSHEVTVNYEAGRFTVSAINSNHDGVGETPHTVQFANYDNSDGWIIIDDDYQAVSQDRILADTQTIGDFTITLPQNPVSGNKVLISPLYPTYDVEPVTVTTGLSGENINGGGVDALLNTNGQSVEFIYVDGTIGWALLNRGDTNIFTNVIIDNEDQYDWQVVDDTYVASSFDKILADSDTIGSFTITLPASPLVGDYVKVAPLFPSYDTDPVTIARNGNLINGDTQDVLLNTVGSSVDLRFIGGTIGWAVINKGDTTIIQTNASNTIHAIEYTLTPSDFPSSPDAIVTLPDNAIVVRARMLIESGSEFDNTPTITIGSAGSPTSVVDTGVFDLTTAGIDISEAYFDVSTTDNDIIATLGSSGTPTQGLAKILIEYYVV